MANLVHCDFCGWQGTSDDLVLVIPEGYGEEFGDDPEALEDLFLNPEYPYCCPVCNLDVFE